MRSRDLLRLSRVSLQNFRCFSKCSVELHPELTVIVAENGRGKTAILDAIGISLGLFVDTMIGAHDSPSIRQTDVHLERGSDDEMSPQLPVEFFAEGTVGGQNVQWSRSLNGVGRNFRATIKDARKLVQAAESLRAHARGPNDGFNVPHTLPVIAFYRTDRLWGEHRKKLVVPEPGLERTSAYINCLSSTASYEDLALWYEEMMNAVRDPRFAAATERPEKLVAAVREATQLALKPSGWRHLDWDFSKQKLVVEHPEQGRLPLSLLSDGVRNMVALIADLAHRCAKLNPHLSDSAARETPGILLVDEVDLHLHPSWQQQVIGLLRKAFPSLQMVLTTHSPVVLSTVDMESIRIIRLGDGAGTLELPPIQTRGLESAGVMATAMGVDPIPQVEEAAWLSDYRSLLQTGNDEAADGPQLWHQLVDHFGQGHPVIQELETLRRIQEFKRRRQPAKEGP